MATQITVDLITDNEREVASILEELPNLFMSRKLAEATSPALQNKKRARPTSPVAPLCPSNSSSEKQLVAPPAKPVKKRKSKKERLTEKKEEVTLLSKEKEDLTREFLELQEKHKSLKAMNFYLKDIRSKPKLVGIKMPANRSSLNFKIKLAPLPHRLLILTALEKPKGEFNQNALVASLKCDREEKAAKAAQARKRRMDIMQLKRTSLARKRPRVR